jgi:hypothetical protein
VALTIGAVAVAAVLLVPEESPPTHTVISATDLGVSAEATLVDARRDLRTASAALAPEIAAGEDPTTALDDAFSSSERDLTSLAVISSRGEIVASAGALLSVVTDSSALLQTLSSGGLTSVPMKTIDSITFVDVAAPILDADGQVSHVLLARYAPNAFFADELNVESTTGVTILDHEGAILASSRAPQSTDVCTSATLTIEGAQPWQIVSCSAPPAAASGGRQYAVPLAAVAGGLALICLAALAVILRPMRPIPHRRRWTADDEDQRLRSLGSRER